MDNKKFTKAFMVFTAVPALATSKQRICHSDAIADIHELIKKSVGTIKYSESNTVLSSCVLFNKLLSYEEIAYLRKQLQTNWLHVELEFVEECIPTSK